MPNKTSLKSADGPAASTRAGYAVVRTSVENCPRTASKRITADLQAVARGTFDFSDLEHLMAVPGPDVGEDE